MTEKLKNIIFILSDQHNASMAGYAGDPWVDTPNLDKLAARSVSLDSCYCASPLCVPSRCSMLASKLPNKTLVYNNNQCLRSDEVTFVHGLANRGYHTILCGRMHFVGPDTRHGYMQRIAGDMGGNAIAYNDNKPNPNQKGNALFKGAYGSNAAAIKLSGAGHSTILEYDQHVTDKACEFLESDEAKDPFFLTIGYYGPHNPYVAPPELFEKYLKRLPDYTELESTLKVHEHLALRSAINNRKLNESTHDDMNRVRAAYYAMIEWMDIRIGQILDKAEKRFGLDNTIIVYGSDHGDMMGASGAIGKCLPYEASNRIPMLISAPALPNKTSYSSATSLMDLGPTLLGLSGAEDMPNPDGKDLSKVLETGELDKKREVISIQGPVKNITPFIMIRKGQWKYVQYHAHEEEQLFDLEKDPGEKVNCIAMDGLEALLANFRKRAAEEFFPEKMIQYEEEHRKHRNQFWQFGKRTNPPNSEMFQSKQENWLAEG